MRRLFECFEKSVESGLTEHVYFVDDIDLVFPHLRRDTYLLDQRANVIDRIVRCRVQLMDIQRPLLVKRPARLARIACLARGRQIHAVDCLGKDTRARCLSHPARAAEQISMCQLIAQDSIPQRSGQRFLPDHAVERRRTVFSG